MNGNDPQQPTFRRILPDDSLAKHAAVIRDSFSGGVLRDIAGPIIGDGVAPASYLFCMQSMVAECHDPVEKIMLEQLIWAHYSIGGLYQRVGRAPNPEVAEVFTTAATRLMAESRKMALALREYRSPVSA